MDRPNFSSEKQKASRLEASIAADFTPSEPSSGFSSVNLADENLAAPHRAPYSELRDLVFNKSPLEVEEAVKILLSASELCEKAFNSVQSLKYGPRLKELANLYKNTRLKVNTALNNYKGNQSQDNKVALVVALNNLASNAPGLGPHKGSNLQVSNNLHPHLTEDENEPTTPRTHAAREAFPKVTVAVTANKEVFSTDGKRKRVREEEFENTKERKLIKTESPPKVRRLALWVWDEKVYAPSGAKDWKLID